MPTLSHRQQRLRDGRHGLQTAGSGDVILHREVPRQRVGLPRLSRRPARVPTEDAPRGSPDERRRLDRDHVRRPLKDHAGGEFDFYLDDWRFESPSGCLPSTLDKSLLSN